MTDIAQRIKAERQRLKMSQKAFASALGTDQTYISKWERGTRPSYENAAKLARLTSRPVADFLDTPTPPDVAKRASIDALVQHYSEEDWQLVYDFAVSLREQGAQRSAAPGPARSAKGTRRRAPSTGKAPAA